MPGPHFSCGDSVGNDVADRIAGLAVGEEHVAGLIGREHRIAANDDVRRWTAQSLRTEDDSPDEDRRDEQATADPARVRLHGVVT